MSAREARVSVGGRGWRRGAAATGSAIAVAAALTGCRGAVVASSAPASAPAVSAPASAAPAGAGSASTGAAGTSATVAAGGAGSVSVSITAPVPVSGTAAVAVSCATGLAYRATVSSAVVDGDQVSFGVDIPRYRGPGSYQAIVSATLRQASGVVTTVAGVSRVPASVTAGGGSFSVSATGSGGRTLAGALHWTCGS